MGPPGPKPFQRDPPYKENYRPSTPAPSGLSNQITPKSMHTQINAHTNFQITDGINEAVYAACQFLIYYIVADYVMAPLCH